MTTLVYGIPRRRSRTYFKCKQCSEEINVPLVFEDTPTDLECPSCKGCMVRYTTRPQTTTRVERKIAQGGSR